MRQVDGVATVRSLAGFVKTMTQAFAETFAKWRMLPESKAQIAQGVGYATRLGNEFMNSRCTAMPVSIYTTDHQATTIEHIVQTDQGLQGGRWRHRARHVPSGERQRRRHGGHQRGGGGGGQVGEPRAVRFGDGCCA